ncbi:MAG: hypothetical protein ACFFFB_22740 [Candidatus Heimdallarchaeota archaeon]
MTDDDIEIKDLEAFIDGLKTSLDMLGGSDISESKGFQAQLAKAISSLRVKRSEKIEPLPKLLGHVTKEDIKNYLIKELENLKQYLDTKSYPKGKFQLVKKIVDLRAEISRL